MALGQCRFWEISVSFKKLLVQVDASPRASTRLKISNHLTEVFEGQLLTLYAANPTGFVANEISLEAAFILKKAIEWDDRREGCALSMVTRALLDSDRYSEWIADRGNAEEACARHSVYADLLVVGQIDPNGGNEVSIGFIDALVCTAGSPILVIPHAGDFKTVGESVLIAWNGSQQAARAVKDALPFLRTAKHVHIVSYDLGREVFEDVVMPGANLALYLGCYGIMATVHDLRGSRSEVVSLLLSRARSLGSDLIVMGAYGYSCAFEVALGSTTKDMLQHMTIPVLMAH
jgi:nucleotide-binding universal stress UspA family protein